MQVEQDGGEHGVDLLVGAHPVVAQVEERLPVDESAGSTPAPAKHGWAGGIGGVGINEQREELLRDKSGAGPEIGLLAGADLGVAEAVGGHREFHGDEGIVAPREEL